MTRRPPDRRPGAVARRLVEGYTAILGMSKWSLDEYRFARRIARALRDAEVRGIAEGWRRGRAEREKGDGR